MVSITDGILLIQFIFGFPQRSLKRLVVHCSACGDNENFKWTSLWLSKLKYEVQEHHINPQSHLRY